MFRAAFTSRSCDAPQSGHPQALIPKPAIPFGPPVQPHAEQVREVLRSLTSQNTAPAFWHLYLSMFLNIVQPASETDFPIRVFFSLAAFTLPTATKLFWRTISVLAL